MFISEILDIFIIMPIGRKIPSDEGQLSIDFIIGFTIFMIAFIFVATMVSGLLINLQTKTIDYDAVAYRTGVVLTEDPGEPDDWQLLDLSFQADKDKLERLGLGIARNEPGIIQENKIIRFFSPVGELEYPNDYADKLIFGDYPYKFNISLKELDGSNNWSIGSSPPDKYGYIRRVVSIKKPGYAVINTTKSSSYNLNIHTRLENYYDTSIDPVHQIDPIDEEFTIFLQNFTIPGTSMTNLELYQYDEYGSSVMVDIPGNTPTIRIFKEDGDQYLMGSQIANNTRIVLETGYLQRELINEYSEVELRLTFSEMVSDGFNLDLENYAQGPPLTWAVMEVKIW